MKAQCQACGFEWTDEDAIVCPACALRRDAPVSMTAVLWKRIRQMREEIRDLRSGQNNLMCEVERLERQLKYAAELGAAQARVLDAYEDADRDLVAESVARHRDG